MKFSELVNSYAAQTQKQSTGGKFAQLVSEYENNPNRWEEYSAQKRANEQAMIDINQAERNYNNQVKRVNAINAVSSDLNAKNVEKYGTADPFRAALAQGGEKYAADKNAEISSLRAEYSAARNDQAKYEAQAHSAKDDASRALASESAANAKGRAETAKARLSELGVKSFGDKAGDFHNILDVSNAYKLPMLVDQADLALSNFANRFGANIDTGATEQRIAEMKAAQQKDTEQILDQHNGAGRLALKGVNAAYEMLGDAALWQATGIPGVLGKAMPGITAATEASAGLDPTRVKKAETLVKRFGARAVEDVATGGTNAAISMRSGLNAYSDAILAGASEEKASKAGLETALLEYFSNKMFGGNPLEDVDRGYVTRLVGSIINKIGADDAVQKLLNTTGGRVFSALMDKVGEGLEEVITGIGDPLIERINYNPEAKIDPKALLEDFSVGVVMSMILGIPVDIANAVRGNAVQGRDAAFPVNGNSVAELLPPPVRQQATPPVQQQAAQDALAQQALAEQNAQFQSAQGNDIIGTANDQMKEVTANGREQSLGGEGRTGGMAPAEQGAGVAGYQAEQGAQREGTGNVRQTVSPDYRDGVSLGIQTSVSAAEDPTKTLREVKSYSKEQNDIIEYGRKRGQTVRFFTGDLWVKDTPDGTPYRIRGLFQSSDNTVWLKADHSTYSEKQIYMHEDFHAAVQGNKKVLQEGIRRLKKQYEGDPAGLRALIDRYVERYHIEGTELSDEYILEEILADAHAGIKLDTKSRSGRAQALDEKTTAKIKKAADTSIKKRDSGTGANKSTVKKSVEELPDGRKYVKADRQVIYGNDIDSWKEQVENYINGKIRNGENVQLLDANGDTLVLTATSAAKLSGYYDGNGESLDANEYETKANAAVHIDELISVSKADGKPPKGDKGKRHGDLASTGWKYRTAFFRDFDNKYYKLTISAAIGTDGQIVYNIGKIEERSFPEISGSSAKGGAVEEGSSANKNSRESEESQEKSSGPKPVSKVAEKKYGVENVDGAVVKASRETWEETDKEGLVSDLVKAGYTKQQATRWVDFVNSVAAVIAADKARLDYESAENHTMLKKNQDYYYTLDASTLCAKRLLYQGTFDAISHRLGNQYLTSDDVIDIRKMMKDAGYEVPCGICYVESRRRHLGRYAKEWVNSYNGEYVPTVDEVTTTDGLEKLRKEHPQAYSDFMTAMKKKGSANPKVVELRAAYSEEDGLMNLTKKEIENIIRIGGMRIQSFSDFETPHLIDTMQAVLDMARLGLTSQAYTKVPNFAWVFGKTGIKINLSLIGDVDADGSLTFDNKEGINYDEAMKLRKAYSKNVGTILVGKSDAHIRAAMKSKVIDFIIPFHRSGWGQSEYEALGLNGYSDYTDLQSEVAVDYGDLDGGQFYPIDYWDYSVNGNRNARTYLEKCLDDGRLPKFLHLAFSEKTAQAFIDENPQYGLNVEDLTTSEGMSRLYRTNSKKRDVAQAYFEYALENGKIENGYWKMLIDFKMYDNSGKGAPQEKVKADFNMEEARRVLGEYEGGANELPVAQDVVDKFVEKKQGTVKASREPAAKDGDMRYSLEADSEGRQLTEAQAEYFKDSVVRDKNGKLKVMYHGTNTQFTVFDPQKSDDKISFFFTDNQNVAKSYATYDKTLDPYQYLPENVSSEEIAKRADAMFSNSDSAGWGDSDYRTVSSAEISKAQKTLDEVYPIVKDAVSEFADIAGKSNKTNLFGVSAITNMLPLLESGRYDTIGHNPIFYKLSNDAELILRWNESKVFDELKPAAKKIKEITDRAVDENEIVLAKTKSDSGSVIAHKKNLVNVYEPTETVKKRILLFSSSGVVPVYLNVSNPLIVDGKGSRWNNIPTPPQMHGEYGDRTTTRSISAFAKKNGYDGVMFNGIVDMGGTSKQKSTRSNVVIAFSPEQIKSVNNLNPTDSTDIRYSREEWQEDLDQMVEDYGEMKPGEKPYRDITLPNKTEKNKNVSQTVRTVLEAKATPDEMVDNIEELVSKGEFSYEVYGDEKAIKDAEKRVTDLGWDKSLELWKKSVKSGKVNKKNTALGWTLYNNAANDGNTATAIDILNNMVEHQRNAAQALQATRILKKMEPETQLYGVARSVANLQEEINDHYGEENAPKLEIDEGLAKQFMKAKTDEERAEILKDIYRDIGRQMPSRFIDKVNAWRYLAMLGNPRTHVRNVVGNAAFAPVVAVKDLTATAIESAVSRVTRIDRTKALLSGGNGKELLTAAWADYANISEDALGGGKYSDLANANKYIEEGKRVFKTKPLEAARKANSAALEVEDQWFSQPHYAYAMAQYCKANGITANQIRNGKGIEKARSYAIKEAQKATYRDTNNFSQFVSNLGRSRMMSKNGVTKTTALLMEGILPFRKTPANILVRGMEYSPLGLIKSLTLDLKKVKSGEIAASEAIDNISAGLTGTGLLALGIYLAAQGLIRGGGSGDDKEMAFEDLTGHQNYALDLPGGTSITLDWMAPEALPFFVGANLWEQTGAVGEGVTFDTLLSSITNVSEPLLEMSCLQSLNDLFESFQYAQSANGLGKTITSAATSYLTQFVPTILGQAERTAQQNRMTTYTSKTGFLNNTDVQYLLGGVSAKIPGWDYRQIEYIDAWGRTESAGGFVKRALNNFLNPAYMSEVEVSDMENELMRLYDATGESVFPTRADKSFKVDGDNLILNQTQYVDYAKQKGTMSYAVATSLTESKAYKEMSDADKVKAVKLVYDYANQTAKHNVAGYSPDSWITDARNAYEELQLPISTFINAKVALADVASLKDKNGNSISNSKGLLVMQKIYDEYPNLSKKQREFLFESFDVGKTVRGYSKSEVDKALREMQRK